MVSERQEEIEGGDLGGRKYIKCPRCKCVSLLNVSSKECIYCGAKLEEGEEVTERLWREYWIGIRGQLFAFLPPKEGVQSKLFKEEE